MVESIERKLKYVYSRQVLYSLGNGMATPFVAPYMAKIGATSTQLGVYTSVNNLLANIAQVFWARIYGFTWRRLPFIVVGGIIASTLWVLIALSTNPYTIILIVGCQAAIGAMTVPAFSAYLGEIAPPTRRGALSAAVNRAAAIGALFATLFGGYLTLRGGAKLTQNVLLPFTIAALLGVVGSLTMLPAKDNARGVIKGNFRLINLEPLRKNRDFRAFTVANLATVAARSLTWPLFTITQIDVLHASLWDMAIFSAAGSAATIILQPFAGKLTDRVGRRPILIFEAFGFTPIPLIYLFANNFAYLVLSNALSGAITAFLNVTTFSYVMDVSPSEQAADYFALNNALQGISVSTISLLGGVLGSIAISSYGLIDGLRLMYMAAFAIRVATSTLYFRVKDVIKFPKTLREEIRDDITSILKKLANHESH
ncbi:MAG: MFS transporter [Thermoprotei archaeon]